VPVSLDDVTDRVIGGALELLPGGAGDWYRTADGRKKVRYALVSVVAVPVGTAAVACLDLIQGSAGIAAVIGNTIGSIPSYVLNRYWVWGKNDKNRFFGEILPFWLITLVGIGFSFVVAHEAGQITRHHGIGGLLRVVILLVANLAGFAVLWVGKYVLFNKVLFVVRHPGSAQAGRGR
jgi:putative flippase GtrA